MVWVEHCRKVLDDWECWMMQEMDNACEKSHSGQILRGKGMEEYSEGAFSVWKGRAWIYWCLLIFEILLEMSEMTISAMRVF